ncbi:MAG: hypothetical protein WA580_10950 [Acidimicrobiales bacterium]
MESIRSRIVSLAPEVASTGIWLLVALVLSVILNLSHSPVAPLPGLASMLIIPGASIMSLLNTRPASAAGRIILAVCLSMMAIMVVGFLSSVLCPLIGIAQPLDAIPQSLIWLALSLLVLVLGAIQRRDPLTWVFTGVRCANVATLLVFSLLVLFSILGVAQLNHTGNARLALFSTVLDVTLLLVGVVAGWKRTSKWPLGTLVYCASLALLLSYSLRGAHLFGWDVQQEFGVASHTVQAGVWHAPANRDPYASMLSLTVLPAILHSVVKLRLLAFFQLVVPGILALLPLAVFTTIRSVPRWITSGRAAPRPGLALAVVVGLIISSVAFSSELVSISRQAMALTMLTALVMVLFDRTISKRPAQIMVALLIVAISFTHYTTSYLLAAIFLCAWPVGLLWSRGRLGTPKARVEKHRYDVNSRRIINLTLVVVALVAAFGWNLAITRNSALDAPSSAISAKGIGIGGSTGAPNLSTAKFEKLLLSELKKSNGYIQPIPFSNYIPLVAANIRPSPGVIPALAGLWNELNFLGIEGLWALLGIALLYGLFRLGRRRSYDYTSDLVGLAITGLLIGGVLRFSGTLATFYYPERAAIFTSILLAAPATLFLDDVATRLLKLRWGRRIHRALFGAGFGYVFILTVAATGLGALFVGGTPPASLAAKGANVIDFTVSTPELATATWIRDHVNGKQIVQSDVYGHLVLMSEPGDYDLIDEIVPPGVDKRAYIYLSTANLAGDITQADADSQIYFSTYHSNLSFFNQNFYVVYSTGATRVYH